MALMLDSDDEVSVMHVEGGGIIIYVTAAYSVTYCKPISCTVCKHLYGWIQGTGCNGSSSHTVIRDLDGTMVHI